MKLIFFLISFLALSSWASVHPDVTEQYKMLEAVNKIRQNGCHCGRRYMEPVQKVIWDETLYKSAFAHASEMKEFNFFAHFSKEGLDIGARMEKSGYNWMVAGENLGEGQKSFEEVLGDWLKSYTHCTMLMNPRVNEMAVAKVDKYWVQHFGKKMPARR